MYEKEPSEKTIGADNQQERSPLSGATYESMTERAGKLLVDKIRIQKIMEQHGEVAMEDLMQRIEDWYKEYERK